MKISVGWSRRIYPFLHRRWDGGAVKISGTVSEGDEVAGFSVHHFPGHAPGQIGLFREADRLALVTDTIYLADSERLKPLPEGEASVPHPAWNWDHGEGQGLGPKARRARAGERRRGSRRSLGGPAIPEMLAAAPEKY